MYFLRVDGHTPKKWGQNFIKNSELVFNNFYHIKIPNSVACSGGAMKTTFKVWDNMQSQHGSYNGRNKSQLLLYTYKGMELQ